MSEGMGLGAICLVQPCQAACVVPMLSILMMGSCYEALASALLSKGKRVGWPWPCEDPGYSLQCQPHEFTSVGQPPGEEVR